MKDMIGTGTRSVVVGRALIVGALPSDSVGGCWALPAFGRYSSIIGQTIMFARPVPCSGRLGSWKVHPSVVPQLDKAMADSTWRITDVSDLEGRLRHKDCEGSHPVVVKAREGKMHSHPGCFLHGTETGTNCHLTASPRHIVFRSHMPTAAVGHVGDGQDLMALMPPVLHQVHREPKVPRKRCTEQEEGFCDVKHVFQKSKRHKPCVSGDWAGSQQDSSTTTMDDPSLSVLKNIGSNKGPCNGTQCEHHCTAQDVGVVMPGPRQTCLQKRSRAQGDRDGEAAETLPTSKRHDPHALVDGALCQQHGVATATGSSTCTGPKKYGLRQGARRVAPAYDSIAQGLWTCMPQAKQAPRQPCLAGKRYRGHKVLRRMQALGRKQNCTNPDCNTAITWGPHM